MKYCGNCKSKNQLLGTGDCNGCILWSKWNPETINRRDSVSSPKERVKMLKNRASPKDIETRYISENGIEIVKNNILVA